MVYLLLNRKERKQLLAIAAGVVLLGIIQTGGVASVLPFMRLVSDPSLLHGEGLAGQLYERIGFASTEAALFAAGVLMLVVIALTNALGALGAWVGARWCWGLNYRLTTDLLGRYVHRPYTFFLGLNTAELNRTLLYEVGSVVTGVLFPMLGVAAQSISALLIVLLLALVDARLALLVAVAFGGAYGIVYALLRRGQRKFGRERFEQNGHRFKIAGEALTGIKDVKTLGREDEFLRRFSEPSRRFSRARRPKPDCVTDPAICAGNARLRHDCPHHPGKPPAWL